MSDPSTEASERVVTLKANFGREDYRLGRLSFDEDMTMPDVIRGLAEMMRQIATEFEFSAQAHDEIEFLLTGEDE